jgi:hypothetical protein
VQPVAAQGNDSNLGDWGQRLILMGLAVLVIAGAIWGLFALRR